MDTVNNNQDLVEKKISDFLDKSSINYNSLKTREKQYLINIENALIKTEQTYSELIKSLKDNTPTLSSIAEDAGIASRQTVYNNPILKNYITDRIKHFSKQSILHEVDYLRDKVQELTRKVEVMMDRDINEEILKYKVKRLKDEIKAREKSILTLEEQSNNKKIELDSLKKQIKEISSELHTSDLNNKTVLEFVKNK